MKGKAKERESMDISKKRIRFLFAMLLAGSACTVFYLAMAGNNAQVYTDVVIEYTSIFSSNKSAERRLIFLLLFAGIVCYGVYFIRTQFKRGRMQKALAAKGEGQDDAKMLLCLLGTMAGICYFVSSNTNPTLLASLIVICIVLLADRTLAMHGFVFFYMGTYAIYGLYRIYVFAGGGQPVSSQAVALIMTAMEMLALLLFQDKRKALQRGILALQLLAPAVLLVYLSSKYLYEDEIVVVSVPGPVQALTCVLIALFLAQAAFLAKKNWDTVADLKDTISFGTCACIMAFNRFSGTGAVMPNDMHHPFENIIGYSQIFELGQKPFSEYIPVSGMYSVIQGAVFQLFGHGQMGNYYVAQNVFYLLAALLVIALLRMQVNGICAFIVSLVFCMMDYNRIVLILPIMLLLTMPRLMEQKGLWLKAWFLASLFHGLYYPLFGVAVCVAFLPLGIWQAVAYARSGQLKEDARTVGFWAGWGICMALAIACIPWLAGTYRHMKAMARQTVYADGIARFGQLVPDWFFAYLGNYQVIRIALYDIFSFMLPAGFVWVAFAFTLKAAGVGLDGKKLRLHNPQGGGCAVSLVIMPMICFASTMVRMDIGSIYARSAGPLFAGAALLAVMLDRYWDGGKSRYFVIFAAVFIPAAGNSIGFFSSGSKLAAYVTVPQGYVYVENDAVEKLGTGFLAQSMYDSAKSAHEGFLEADKGQSYFGEPGYFGFFYLNDVKGDGPMELLATVRGYEATQEAIAVVRENGTIIGTEMNPFYNYYFYHWLLTSGEYLWSADLGCFLPNAGKAGPDRAKEENKNLTLSWDGLDIGKNACSLGMSLDSLKEVLTPSDVRFTAWQDGDGLQVGFADAIDGDEADYLYLEFSGMDQNFQYTLFNLNGEQGQDGGLLAKYLMKKNYNPGMQVVASWSDENGEAHTMGCAMSQGKLLIPLGAGAKWLLHGHAYLHVAAVQDGQEIPLPEAVDIQFFKLREAG